MPRWLEGLTQEARKPERATASTLALAALALPVGSALAASNALDDKASTAPTVDTAPDTSIEAAPGGSPLSFASAFETLGAPSAITGPAPGSVDLGSFETPRGAQVIRTLGTGVASFYGKRFHGRRTANGERFNMNAMTAAHKTLPFGTFVRVINPANGRTVIVRINDRGPFIRGREIDLSRAAAQEIGMIQRGHARVQLDVVAP